MTRTRLLSSPVDVAAVVQRQGFLPFFHNEIEGFSLEESVSPQYWFPEEEDGVWEWKSNIIALAECAYGKFYQNKACWISMEWFPDFANYRRSLYSLSNQEQNLLDTLSRNESMLSKELKKECGYTQSKPTRKPWEHDVYTTMRPPTKGKAAFDTAITRLQMAGYVIIANFEYAVNAQGKSFGWGLARYCTPESLFGIDAMHVNRTPQQSRQRLINHLHTILPTATSESIDRLVGRLPRK